MIQFYEVTLNWQSWTENVLADSLNYIRFSQQRHTKSMDSYPFSHNCFSMSFHKISPKLCIYFLILKVMINKILMCIKAASDMCQWAASQRLKLNPRSHVYQLTNQVLLDAFRIKSQGTATWIDMLWDLLLHL